MMPIDPNTLQRYHGPVQQIDDEKQLVRSFSVNPYFHVSWYYIRVGWWISKAGENGVKWKLLGIETADKINFSPKNAYLRNEQELGRIEEVWPNL